MQVRVRFFLLIDFRLHSSSSMVNPPIVLMIFIIMSEWRVLPQTKGSFIHSKLGEREREGERGFTCLKYGEIPCLTL